MDDPWKCPLCGLPIGAYEPIVVVEGERERRTSRLAEPEPPEGGRTAYHEDCRIASLRSAA